MRSYKPLDFKDLFINPYELPDSIDLVREFPILGLYKSFSEYYEAADINKVVRYIIYAFDENTPTKTFSNLVERRAEAAELAGFEKEKEMFDEAVMDIIKCRNLHVNQMIIDYCSMSKGDDYVTLITFQESLRTQAFKLMHGDDDEKTKDLINNVNSLRENIKTIQNNILGDNNDIFLIQSFKLKSESERLLLSPEDYAHALADKNIDVFEYWEKKYGKKA